MIESARNTHNKFMNVASRSKINSQQEMSFCKPELVFTHLQSSEYNFSSFYEEEEFENSLDQFPLLHNTSSSATLTNTTNFEMLCSTNPSNSTIIDRQKDEGKSIISTAEEHFRLRTTMLNSVSSLKPKSTSSTASLLKLVRSKIVPKSLRKSNKSITFNVDVASTPKKVLPRSSTPKRIVTSKPLISSTVIETKTKKQVQKAKIIPPPIFSSSVVGQKIERVRVCKRKRSSGKKEHNTKKQKQSTTTTTTTTSKLFKKYPIKFYPNMRIQDIDRVNFVDLGIEYNYGDYNVWYL